jgi:DNA-binding NtrC family response regulator
VDRDEFLILQRVSSAVNATLDLEEIYDVALRTMGELFEFHHAIILLVEPGSDMLRVVASRGYENQAIGGRVKVGTGVIGIVAERRKMLHVANLGQQRAYAAAQRRQMMKSGRGGEITDAVPVPGLPNAESQIAIPLLIRDELVGVFSIESPVRRSFDPHEQGLVAIVANQIASAIRNAQLYEDRRQAAEDLQAANASLEARVAERTAALERELRVAQELLKDARSRVEGPLIGTSPAVTRLRDDVARAAGHSEPLLLVGPPGSGREAVAYAVHAAAHRPGAFILVSCPELHTPGQAVKTTKREAFGIDPLLTSKLELAAGGTLFLESFHEMPADLRSALFDVMTQQAAARSRGETPAPDVRIVASTLPDRAVGLRSPIDWHRLTLPALVDRREDIPALVEHFIHRQARQFGKVIDGVSRDSMRRLDAYAWPGNIRELRTVLERAVLVSRGTVLEIDQELLDEQLSVGSYRLVSKLGSGGMGEVWLGRHRLLARPAAVKLIRADVSTGEAREQFVRRFQREAHVTAGLRSPHTVQLYDFGVNDTGSFYYVMELLEGLDLHQIVERFGPQAPARTIALFAQACRSLAEAHERGLVHRDIKPANLFVARLGAEYDYLKVLDFGIVKDRPGQDATMITAHGIVQGTPAFIAPELAFGEGAIDGRADIYSLGCAMYYTLTGQPVFRATSPAQMLLHHAQTPPGAPSNASELPIPDALDRLVLQCLAKDPDARPFSAQEVERALAVIPVEPWTTARAKAWWELHAPDTFSN